MKSPDKNSKWNYTTLKHSMCSYMRVYALSWINFALAVKCRATLFSCFVSLSMEISRKLFNLNNGKVSHVTFLTREWNEFVQYKTLWSSNGKKLSKPELVLKITRKSIWRKINWNFLNYQQISSEWVIARKKYIIRLGTVYIIIILINNSRKKDKGNQLHDGGCISDTKVCWFT